MNIRSTSFSVAAQASMTVLACAMACSSSSAATTATTTAAAASQTVATTTVVVRARGSISANFGPNMELRVNGALIGSTEVRAMTFQNYSFTASAIAGGAKVDVVFTNDLNVNGQDRNLEVESITINGVTLPSTASGVSFDRGAGAAAFDGIDTMTGRQMLAWNGALRFTAPAAATQAPAAAATDAAFKTSTLDAMRLADQATFGASEGLINEIRGLGDVAWVAKQMTLTGSSYKLGNGDAIHKNVTTIPYCTRPGNVSTTCARDWLSNVPLVWDLFRNATQQPDQLRQRVALALQQIAVVSTIEVEGTYGHRNYANMLLSNALGNYRQVLKGVILSPVMGEYLNNVNNNKNAPNENFGRELLQLFSIGTCELNLDGSMKSGACVATYDNTMVRNYAYALTGWTFPVGGSNIKGCNPAGANCRYHGGDMVPLAAYHDTTERPLLSGVTVPAGNSAPQALELVLDSLMAHPNTAPFIGRQLIQHLVSSNPSPAYVQRVAAAFVAGRYVAGGQTFGTGVRGDLKATAAAVLLDAEARTETPAKSAGRLREPVLMLTGVLRGLNGKTDGADMNWWWGERLKQHLFRPPSVFNFYPPDFPVPGGALVAPAFGIHSASTALIRLNYLTYILYWPVQIDTTVPGASGSVTNLQPFDADTSDPAKLVDRFSVIATGAPLPSALRTDIIAAVNAFTPQNHPDWKAERIKQAAYLVFGSPNYQLPR